MRITEKTRHPSASRSSAKAPAIHGREGHGEKSAGEHVIQDFRDYKGDLAGVDLAPGPACIGNDHLPRQPDHPAQQDRGHHDEGCDADLPIGGGSRSFSARVGGGGFEK